MYTRVAAAFVEFGRTVKPGEAAVTETGEVVDSIHTATMRAGVGVAVDYWVIAKLSCEVCIANARIRIQSIFATSVNALMIFTVVDIYVTVCARKSQQTDTAVATDGINTIAVYTRM